MFSTIKGFIRVWSAELEATQKILKHITDKSLEQAVVPGGSSIRTIAWHIVLSLPEMMNRTGLSVTGPGEHAPAPSSSTEIFDAYCTAAESLLNQVQSNWTDASLQLEDAMYGEKWKRSFTLTALVSHQIHHRAQLTVLMRQAGLQVPGIYGPSNEEWALIGMKAPE
jgi:uncharacterized damage-inducible protein DinB